MVYIIFAAASHKLIIMALKISPNSTKVKKTLFDNDNLPKLTMDYRRQLIVSISVLVLVFAIFGFKKPQLTPFEEFAQSTTRVFREINNVQLSSSNEVVRYKVECLRIGNMVQNSPAFPNGKRIFGYLENSGKTVAGAGYSLQAMYQRGNNLFWTYNVELRNMIKVLRSDTPMSISAYIIGRMAFLRTEVNEYQAKVAYTRDQVLLAEEAQILAEKELLYGKRNGEKYLADQKKNRKSAEVRITTEELSHVIRLLDQMHEIAQQLGKLNNILLFYSDVLIHINGKIKENSKEYEKDIELLWYLGENLRALHEGALNKSIIGI